MTLKRAGQLRFPNLSDPVFLSIFTAVAVASASSAQAQTAPAVTVPAEIAAHVPADLRSYFVGFKVNPAVPREMPHELFVRHQAYIRQKVAEGVYHLVGPFTDGGRIRGMTILSAPSLEEAKRIIEGDPAVQEKVFAVEVHPAIFPNLGSLKIAYPPKAKP